MALVPFPENLRNRNGRGTNKWGCEWVAICPTMRSPADVRWDQIVYKRVWRLLRALGKRDQEAEGVGVGLRACL